MTDKLKAMGNKEIGKGGINCPCCGPAPGPKRKALKRRARRRLHQEDKKNFKNDD
jgi:hypothetical protein